MVGKWIVPCVCLLSWTGAAGQFRHETHSRTHWEGLDFIHASAGSTRLPKTCGIYNTHADWQSGTLSLSIDCGSEDHKIRSAFVGDKSAIKVVRDEETYHYLSRDIYGYRDCKGEEFHIFEGKRYQLLNPGEHIPIYRNYQWVGKQRIAKHFFSRRSLGTIKSLTLENLSADFSDEPLFLEKLRLLAKNDFELVRYRHAINRLRANFSNESQSVETATDAR